MLEGVIRSRRDLGSFPFPCPAVVPPARWALVNTLPSITLRFTGPMTLLGFMARVSTMGWHATGCTTSSNCVLTNESIFSSAWPISWLTEQALGSTTNIRQLSIYSIIHTLLMQVIAVHYLVCGHVVFSYFFSLKDVSRPPLPLGGKSSTTKLLVLCTKLFEIN